MIQEYLEKIIDKFKSDDASERTYYPVLETLLTKFSPLGKILIESKNSPLGIPDFRVDNEKELLLGYIEAKDLGRDLDKLTPKEQEQIEGYIKEYPKLIVTNFIEFRLYEDGQEVEKVIIAESSSLKQLTNVPINEAKLLGLLERFFSFPIKRVYTAKRLAELLAKKTHLLRSLVKEEINLGDEITTSTEDLLDAFRKTLRPDISEDDFADMYAQTVTYGLFSARLNAEEKEFNRLTAYNYIPATIPLLKKIFYLISGQDIPQHIRWLSNEIAEILANTDIKKIQNEFFKQGKGRDPIIHFYETFLSEYDPKEREKRGVYYTPEPIVSYIIRSVNKLLKYKFGKTTGFADETVKVLDPAAGTLTFLANAISVAKDEYVAKYGNGGWEKLIKEHILKNFYAFELLMAPYTVGHLKISLLLKESGYEMQEDDRFKLYLTNTLDFKEIEDLPPLLSLIKEITEESKKAFEVKTKEFILVITGNPPYSVSSSNIIEKGSDFYNLYESYKALVRQQEKNIQPLSDDYIKFIAFAHWKIKQNDQGIVAMITNNSYLDGLIHRDMRRKLMEDFNEIYILNLHGNSKRKGKSPDGGKDENVFDIQQGVSIVVLVKNKYLEKFVKYEDLWGSREEKYEFLEKNDVYNTDWMELKSKPQNNFFVPKNTEGEDKYNKFISLTSIFDKKNAGTASGKDDVLVDFNKQSLLKRMSTENKDAFETFMEANDVSKDLIKKWLDELNKMDLEEHIKSYTYRPFDKRFFIYSNKMLQRARTDIMDNFLKNNLAICVTNSSSQDFYSEVFISDAITDKHLTGHQTYVFPLYIYNKRGQQNLLSKIGMSINFKWGNLGWLQTLQPFTSKLSSNFIQTEQAIFYYMYAVLYSNIYRKKYQEFLKIDFPRIPFTKDYELFKALAQRGEQLINIHLLNSEDLSNPIAKFEGKGDAFIEDVKRENNFVYINKNQYFLVSNEVWNYYIGGYQVANKWLKNRKGRKISSEEIKHYCKTITAISKTIELQKEIDRLYSKIEEDLS